MTHAYHETDNLPPVTPMGKQMRIDTITTFRRAAALGFNRNREDTTDANMIPALCSTTEDMTVSTNCQFQTSTNGRCQDGITLIGTDLVKAFFSCVLLRFL